MKKKLMNNVFKKNSKKFSYHLVAWFRKIRKEKGSIILLGIVCFEGVGGKGKEKWRDNIFDVRIDL